MMAAKTKSYIRTDWVNMPLTGGLIFHLNCLAYTPYLGKQTQWWRNIVLRINKINYTLFNYNLFSLNWADFHILQFLPRDAMLSVVHAVVVCTSVCVTLRYCVKTAKRRITQIMPHDSDKHVAKSLCHSRASCYIKCSMFPYCCWTTHSSRRRHWPMAWSVKRCNSLPHWVTFH